MNNPTITSLQSLELTGADKATRTRVLKKIGNNISNFTARELELISRVQVVEDSAIEESVKPTTEQKINFSIKKIGNNILQVIGSTVIQLVKDSYVEKLNAIVDSYTYFTSVYETYIAWMNTPQLPKPELATDATDKEIEVFTQDMEAYEEHKLNAVNAYKLINITLANEMNMKELSSSAFGEAIKIYKEAHYYRSAIAIPNKVTVSALTKVAKQYVLKGTELALYGFSYDELIAIQMLEDCGYVSVHNIVAKGSTKQTPKATLTSIVTTAMHESLPMLKLSLMTTKYMPKIEQPQAAENVRVWRNGKMFHKSRTLVNHSTALTAAVDKLQSIGYSVHPSFYTSGAYEVVCKELTNYDTESNDVAIKWHMNANKEIIAKMLLSLKDKTYYMEYTRDNSGRLYSTKLGSLQGDKTMREYITLSNSYKVSEDGLLIAKQYVLAQISKDFISKDDIGSTFNNRLNDIKNSALKPKAKRLLNMILNYESGVTTSNEIVGLDGTNQGSQLLAVATRDSMLGKYTAVCNTDGDEFITMYQAFSDIYYSVLKMLTPVEFTTKEEQVIFNVTVFKYKSLSVMYNKSTMYQVHEKDELSIDKRNLINSIKAMMLVEELHSDIVPTKEYGGLMLDTIINGIFNKGIDTDILEKAFDITVDRISPVIYKWKKHIESCYTDDNYQTHYGIDGVPAILVKQATVKGIRQYPANRGNTKSIQTHDKVMSSVLSSGKTALSPHILQSIDSTALRMMATASNISGAVHDEYLTTLNNGFVVMQDYRDVLVSMYDNNIGDHICTQHKDNESVLTLGDGKLTRDNISDSEFALYY